MKRAKKTEFGVYKLFSEYGYCTVISFSLSLISTEDYRRWMHVLNKSRFIMTETASIIEKFPIQ